MCIVGFSPEEKMQAAFAVLQTKCVQYNYLAPLSSNPLLKARPHSLEKGRD